MRVLKNVPLAPVPENATPGQSNTSQLTFVFFSTLLEVFRLGGGQFRLESREADPVARCPMSVSWAGTLLADAAGLSRDPISDWAS